MQKHCTDRAAGKMALAAGQSNVLLSYTHIGGVKSLVRTNLSSAPGYRTALIAAMAKFQLAQA